MKAIEQKQFQRLLNRNVLFPLFFGSISALFFVAIILYLLSLARWIEKNDITVNTANIMVKLIIDQETSMRGFLITRDDTYLQPYQNADELLPPTIEKLRNILADDLPQKGRLEAIVDNYRHWHDYAERAIQLRGQNVDMRSAVSPQGKQMMDEIREQESALLAELENIREHHISNARMLVTVLVGSFLLLSLSLNGVLAHLGRRQMIGLASSYEKLLQDLDLQNTALHDEEWLRVGELGLAEQIIGQLPLPILCQNILTFFAGRIGVLVGAIYVDNGEGNFRREANYGFSKNHAQQNQQFERGEGLVGQAAAENRMILLNELPVDYLKISSGLGEVAPLHVLLVPISAETSIVAVLELGFFRKVEQRDLTFLERIAENIGAAVVAAMYRRRLNDALRAMQQLNDELQIQQNELQAANDELEEQSQILAESQQRLASQHAELEIVNRALQENNEILSTTRSLLEQRALQLEQASRYKSEFLANMSHELRTPLNSALILSKLLADNAQKNLTEEQVRFANAIYSAGKDLLALINDVLDLSKVEAGKIDIVPNETQVARVVDALRIYFEPVALEKNLAFTLSIDDDVPAAIHTDRQRLEQILRNLLSNAFKFTTEGAVNLSVKKAEADKLAFAVGDSGIGINAERQEAIFEPFQQIDSATNRKYGGAGLGLSISRDLARLLGGSLSVVSAPGQGSTFTLTIPAELRNVPALQHMDFQSIQSQSANFQNTNFQNTHFQNKNSQNTGLQKAGPQTVFQLAGFQATGFQKTGFQITTPQATAFQTAGRQVSAIELPVALRNAANEHSDAVLATIPIPDFADDRDNKNMQARTILVVEDEIQFARILYDLAHEFNYNCLVTTSAEEAFELATQHRPDAILLDMKLPDHSGLSVLARLKEEPLTRHIPVHVLSVEERSSVALRMGAVSYALKPITHEQLRALFADIEENFTSKTKNVLLVENFARHEQSTAKLIAGNDINVTTVAMGEQALHLLQERTFDCMIADYELADMTANQLLARMTAAQMDSLPPVIVYSPRNLSREEECELLRHSHSIIVKGVRSPERLVDEVTLFLHCVEADFSDEKQHALRRNRVRNRAFESRKILVVDDDVRNIFALTSVLENKGANVAVGRNGIDAIKRLDEIADIDLVLMDIMMPEMDGYEAIEKIRQDRRFAKLPIIAVTAKAMREDLERCLLAGANDYVAKPINLDRLVSLIHAWLPQVQRM